MFNKNNLYTFLIMFFMTAQWSLGAAIASEPAEYYVLFRGHHFINTRPYPSAEEMATIMGRREDVLSPQAQKTLPDSHKSLISRIHSLRRKPMSLILNKDGSTSLYHSAMHWVQEYYFNDYYPFRSDLKKKTSLLRQTLDQHGLPEADEIFLISTSLNPYSALKFASGMAKTEKEKLLPAYKAVFTENNEIEMQPQFPVLGYVDVFLIPKKEITALRPFYVFEECFLHRIALRRDYYLDAQEINFPISLPARYHWRRIPFEMPALEPCKILGSSKIPYDVAAVKAHMESMAHSMQQEVDTFMLQHKAQRFWFSPHFRFTPHLPFSRLAASLTTSNALEIRHKIAATAAELGAKYSTGTSFREVTETLDPINCHALAYLGRGGGALPIRTRFSLEKNNIEFLLPLIRTSSVSTLALMSPDHARGVALPPSPDDVRYFAKQDDETEEEIDAIIESNRDELEGQYFWQDPGPYFSSLLNILEMRKKPITLDITGHCLHPRHFAALRSLRHVTLIDEHRESNWEHILSIAEEYDGEHGWLVSNLETLKANEGEDIDEGTTTIWTWSVPFKPCVEARADAEALPTELSTLSQALKGLENLTRVWRI